MYLKGYALQPLDVIHKLLSINLNFFHSFKSENKNNTKVLVLWKSILQRYLSTYIYEIYSNIIVTRTQIFFENISLAGSEESNVRKVLLLQ